MNILTIKNLDIWYTQNKNIIENLSLEIEDNQIIGLIGLNGAGKTTLFNTICGIHDKYKCDEIFYCDKKSHENNIYIKYQILYYNHYNKCDMYDVKYCLIDCECDVCDIDDSSYIIIERYIDLLINCNMCERLRIENVKFIF